MKNIYETIKERILILDGAIGTMIQKYGLSENDFRGDRFRTTDVQMKGNNDILNITREDIILDIHRRYLKAGADIIETNTFSSQRISQKEYSTESYCREMAQRGAAIARKAADEFSTPSHPRFVAGSVGPTNKTCSMCSDVCDPASRDISFDELHEAYSEQIDALMEGGVDTVLIETSFDTLNMKAAICAANDVMDKRGRAIPIMLSITISDLAGRTLSGQSIDAFLASISSYDIFSVGINCGFGARQMKPFLSEMARKAPWYISAHPNAGLPNAMGEYDETPATMTSKVKEIIDEGLVNIIGGCCGTTDEFIARFAETATGKQPHKVAHRTSVMQLSGLDSLSITPDRGFINVGERCNVAGSRKFLRCIEEKRYDDAAAIARKEIYDGAMVIDINMDAALLDTGKEMMHFINLITTDPEIAKTPIMIDSSKWDVITTALKCVQGKSIVNSISLKEGEQTFISHANDIKRYGAACVVMCFDEEGQATSYQRRIDIARRAYDILTQKVGMEPCDIIIDPNILTIATGMHEHDNYALDFINATKWIRENLPGCHVSGGVSNLSFAFRGNNYIREAMHAVFLHHAVKAGMDFGIVNPASKVTYCDIPHDQLSIIEDVVLNRRSNAYEKLTTLANELKIKAEREKNGESDALSDAAKETDQWRSLSIDERLSHALRRGLSEHLKEDIAEALRKYGNAVSIIEGPLMTGMKQVGRLFGEGKMFLPQVIKTARTMKDAVSILQPYIEKDKDDMSAKAGKIVIATVKGDVHDIGKNIVGVVMSCNNYEVIDLGVMVPAYQIVNKVIETGADMVGLSGLITPSLEEMVHIATAMHDAGLRIPIMIGGATTSELHVALKIAPVYDGPVIWIKDAAQNPIVAKKLMNSKECDEFIRQTYLRYEQLRNTYGRQDGATSPIEKARRNKLLLFGNNGK